MSTWVESYRDGIEYAAHRDGVDWMDAPKPRRWHRCRPQTRGFFHMRLVERCPCGAARLDGNVPGCPVSTRGDDHG